MSRRISAEKRAMVEERLRARNCSRSAIAREVGVSGAAVLRIARYLGIEPLARTQMNIRAARKLRPVKQRRRQRKSAYPWLLRGARTPEALKQHRARIERDCWPGAPEHVKALRAAAREYDRWNKHLVKPEIHVPSRAERWKEETAA